MPLEATSRLHPRRISIKSEWIDKVGRGLNIPRRPQSAHQSYRVGTEVLRAGRVIDAETVVMQTGFGILPLALKADQAEFARIGSLRRRPID